MRLPSERHHRPVLDGTTGTRKPSPVWGLFNLCLHMVTGNRSKLSLQISESAPNSNTGPHVSELPPAPEGIPVADHRHMTLNSQLIWGCKSYCASKVNSRFRAQSRPPSGTCGRRLQSCRRQSNAGKGSTTGPDLLARKEKINKNKESSHARRFPWCKWLAITSGLSYVSFFFYCFWTRGCTTDLII